MDLYNKLVHNGGQDDDVVRQLQGARSQLSAAKDENKKLAEELSEAEKMLETLEKDREFAEESLLKTNDLLTIIKERNITLSFYFKKLSICQLSSQSRV